MANTAGSRFSGQKLSKHIGFELNDVDARLLRLDDIAQLRALWNEHLLLVFRDQHLSAEEQTRFSALLGSVRSSPSTPPEASIASRYTAIIGNRELGGIKPVLPEGEMWFHYDQMYRPEPAEAAILYGVEIPSKGGDTLFANSVAAYQALPLQLRQRLHSLRAEHIYDYRATTRQVSADEHDSMRCVHPVVVEHHRTARPSLFVSRLMTSRILELGEDESEELLERLFQHLEDPRFHYRHRWRKGDLLVWDNTSALHARTNFSADEARILRRTSLDRLEAPKAPQDWRTEDDITAQAQARPSRFVH